MKYHMLPTELVILRKLISDMADIGWHPTHVDDDGEDLVDVSTSESVLVAVDAVDWSRIRFEHIHEGNKRHSWVTVILGNGVDCIADYTCRHNDFNAIVDSVYEFADGL